MGGPKLGGVEPHPFHHPWPEVLDEHVGIGDRRPPADLGRVAYPSVPGTAISTTALMSSRT